MAASSDLALPLVLVSFLLIPGHASLATLRPRGVENTATEDYDLLYDEPVTPWSPSPAPHGSDNLVTEDYENLYDDTVTTRSPGRVPQTVSKPQKCDYDVCREGQRPCAELKIATGCLCPGITLGNVLPLAPALKTVSREGSEVVVRWCAPYSDVTAYKVTVGGEEREFGEGERRFTAGRIADTVRVCVVAVNDAGPGPGSCKMYTPKGSSVSLKAGLIGGALGFLLLLSLAVLLWRHRVRRKAEARISTRNTEETPRTELESLR